jgi:hypothetical protein
MRSRRPLGLRRANARKKSAMEGGKPMSPTIGRRLRPGIAAAVPVMAASAMAAHA